MLKTVLCDDGKKRCSWCLVTEQYMDYHDNEWGNPITDDRTLFEKLCLESFQSGLSWRTILEKRENFRKAFKNFDIQKVSKFTEKDIERLMNDKGIVRNRKKIEAVINNANRAIELKKEVGSLSDFFWSFKPEKDLPIEFRATSEESISLSKELKKRGWKFLGPTTVYSFMQAMGIINDHAKDCFKRKI